MKKIESLKIKTMSDKELAVILNQIIDSQNAIIDLLNVSPLMVDAKKALEEKEAKDKALRVEKELAIAKAKDVELKKPAKPSGKGGSK